MLFLITSRCVLDVSSLQGVVRSVVVVTGGALTALCVGPSRSEVAAGSVLCGDFCTVCLGSRDKSTRAHHSLLKIASDQKKLLG